MAAVTGCTEYQVLPNAGLRAALITTPSTADSADSIDVSDSAVTGGETFTTVYGAWAYDNTTGDSVTATWSGTVITLDAAGATTNHVYKVIVFGI
jgi:hypothetical protein